MAEDTITMISVSVYRDLVSTEYQMVLLDSSILTPERIKAKNVV